jgi:hypothetical protein
MFYEDSKSRSLIWVTSFVEIGIGLIVLGLMIYTIGVFLFLDRAMLAIGNVKKILIERGL